MLKSRSWGYDDMVIKMIRQLIYTGTLPRTDNAEEEGHDADGKVTEGSGRFEENTNEFDAINVLCLQSPFKWRG